MKPAFSPEFFFLPLQRHTGSLLWGCPRGGDCWHCVFSLKKNKITLKNGNTTVKSESYLLNFWQTKLHQKYMWGECSILRCCKLSNTCIYIYTHIYNTIYIKYFIKNINIEHIQHKIYQIYTMLYCIILYIKYIKSYIKA